MNAALLVLGMHRSGTSALTRVLSLLGAQLPSNLMPGYEGKNDLGHWESLDLMKIHDAMLASVGSSWDDVTEFPESWYGSPVSEGYRAEILDVLNRDYAGSPLFVVKDPRVCRFVPLWLDLVEHFGAKPHVIIPIRNPLEVASSLKRRDGFSIAKGAMLWLRHALDAEHATRDSKRSLITYEALLDDWGTVAEKIGHDLGLSWPRSAHRAAAEIEEFLSVDFRHHRASPESLRSHSQIVSWVADAYDALIDATRNDDESARNRLDTIRDAASRADRAFGPILADAQIRIERAEQQLESAGETLAERERRIAELESLLAAERDRVTHSTDRIAQLDADLAQQDRKLAENDSALLGKTQELEERNSQIVALMADASERDREIAERDSRMTSLDRDLSVQRAELAGRDALIASLESSRRSEQGATEFLQRLIYESQQEILRDFTILERLDAVEHRGAKIEACTNQAMAILSEAKKPALTASLRPGRQWARHLPSPSILKARLKSPARKVLAGLGVLNRGERQ